MKDFVNIIKSRAPRFGRIQLYRSFLVLLAMLIMVASSTAASHKIDYRIIDGDTEYTLRAFTDEPESVLFEAGIVLNPGDSYEVYQRGGELCLEIRRSVLLSVAYDGTQKNVVTGAATVAELLEELQIVPGEEDRLNYSPDTPLTDGMCLELTRVETEYETLQTNLPHTLEYTQDSDLYEGKVIGTQAGSDGSVTVTYKCVYEDGRLVSREVCSSVVSSEPVNTLISFGTKERPVEVADLTYEYKNGMGVHVLTDYASYKPSEDNGETVTTFTGTELAYDRVVYCDATAYSCDGVPSKTASGMDAAMGVVATDWSILPNGTRLYIVAADGSWEYGCCVVGDNGAFSGPIVDLYMDTLAQCWNFGTSLCKVYVLSPEE